MPTLKDIIDEIEMEASTIDSIFRNKSRFMMSKFGRVGLKKLSLTFSTGLRGMNAEIPASCQIYKTDDFMRFVRAYLINCDGMTMEIYRNAEVPEDITNYLLDCDGSLVRDCDNTPVYTDCLDCNSGGNGVPDIDCTTCCGTGKHLNAATAAILSEIERLSNSWIKEHKDRFEFSTDLEGMKVVIEYLSNKTDSANECDLHVPDEYADALENFIKWKILEGGQDTMGLSQYYKQQFKTERNKAKSEQTPMSKRTLYAIMTMRN